MTTRFDAPDSVASATTVTAARVGGGVRFEAGPHAIFTAYGYDGFRGHVDLGLAATGATLSGPSATGLTVPEQIFPAGGAFEVLFEQGPGAVVPSLTAGAPGTATVKVTTTAAFTFEVHKTSTGVWNPWTMTCTIKVTNPPQNPVFSLLDPGPFRRQLLRSILSRRGGHGCCEVHCGREPPDRGTGSRSLTGYRSGSGAAPARNASSISKRAAGSRRLSPNVAWSWRMR
jgi:hypothetical protein